MAKDLLEVKEIDTHYGLMPVLRRVNIIVADGEVVFVMGVNGAGKTTLLRTISGLVKPTYGKIMFRGKAINGLPPEVLVKMGISHVLEGKRLFGNMSVMENLEVGGYTRNSRSELIHDFEMIFSHFPRLAERKNQLARQLSGGEQQMLAIARGLISRPSLLLLDEPSLGLSPLLVEEMAKLITVFREKFNTSILLVEQNMSLALELSSRGYILESGEVKLSGGKSELASSELLRRLFLGGEVQSKI